MRAAACIALLVLCGGLAPRPAEAALRHFTVQELEPVKAKWLDTEIAVEGRWSLFGKHQIKLKNSDIIFRSEKELQPLTRTLPNIEISGQMVRERGRYVFFISSFRQLPSDAEHFEQRKRQILGENPEEWYKLAAWAQERGTFYQDAELLEQGVAAKVRGFNIGRQRMPADDPEARFKLAAQAKTLGLPETVAAELVHEGFTLERQRALKERQPRWEELAARVARDLPGSLIPLDPDPPELRRKYLERPLEVYAAADDAERGKLHRILWSDIVRSAIVAQAAPDAANGFEIAKQLDQRVPEFHALAEEYRDQALALRAEKVSKLTRTEVLALRQEYRNRNQPEQGQDVVESWLTLRRKRLAPDDLEGLLFLAEEYIQLLERPDEAARLLMEAHERQPDAPEIARRLEALGYHFQKGRWLTDAEFKAVPEGKLAQALREGRVEVGMTAAQVRKSLGVPVRTTRLATAGEVCEVWNYGQAGAAQASLIIYLVKHHTQREAKVVRIGP